MKNTYKKIIIFIVSILICQVAGIIGSLFNISSLPTWYQSLNKPFFNPPNWIFAPVWTTLFVLMGISLAIVWSKGLKDKHTKIGMWFFGVQLILNVLWSFFFFYLKNPFFAFIEIIILWIFILLTMLKFRKVSKTAFWLMLPYLLWVSFAAMLNLSFILLN